MAKNKLVLLGFEDEPITEKHFVNFTTNKIGGKPDWVPLDNEPSNPSCHLCGLSQLLILQIYAPLENSLYHRTLYLFSCINTNCWNQSQSWTCLRSQSLDKNTETNASTKSITSIEWCGDADDWNVDESYDNINEENGNLITNNCGEQKSDNDDEESYSFEDSLSAGLEELCVDSKNANTGPLLAEAQGGAVGRLHSPTATAEIEGEENELVTIDTPTSPLCDITALLQETVTLPPEICHNSKSDRSMKVQFLPIFIRVGDEDSRNYSLATIFNEHIRELMNEYQIRNEGGDEEMEQKGGQNPSHSELMGVEKYEKSVPIHGDVFYHSFISKIQMNPGQILRYSRDGLTPLLLSPLTEMPKRCQYCQGSLLLEMQVLPTLIPKLNLQNTSSQGSSHLEFGSVLIFTCLQSCWEMGNKVREEIVVVQSERF